jgi:UDP-glucuronate 4-epimerase
MAYFSFTKSIIEGRPIDVYNFGKMKRDFTYIDDIIEGVVRILSRAPESGSRVAPAALAAATPEPPYKIYNIGNNKPVELEVLIRTIERCVGRKATLNFMPMQPGEVVETYADIAELEHVVGFRPVTDLDQGIAQFVEWFREFYNHPVSMTG